MPAPSAILARPEFAILRRLTVEQLRRIKPRWVSRANASRCPLKQALRRTIYAPIDVIEGLIGEGIWDEGLWREAWAFLSSWDGEGVNSTPMSRADLAAAIQAALAEKEGADDGS